MEVGGERLGGDPRAATYSEAIWREDIVSKNVILCAPAAQYLIISNKDIHACTDTLQALPGELCVLVSVGLCLLMSGFCMSLLAL